MSTDKELDDYLKGGSELSRAYADADDIAPPAHLDAAILAQAHRAVYARPAVVTETSLGDAAGLGRYRVHHGDGWLTTARDDERRRTDASTASRERGDGT